MKTLTKLSLILFILFSVLCSLLSAPAGADIPYLINYQGKLTDKDGKPIEGTKSITFRIYDVESGGSPLWSETQSVTIAAANKGIFNVLLGSTTNLNLPFDIPYYLAIKVETDAEMTPRQRITSAGYAYTAERLSTNLPVTNLNSGTGASSSTFWRGDGTWAQPASAYTYSGAQVFSGNAPTSYTDLNLNSVVGANRALVYLKVKATSSVSHIVSFRTNGDTETVGYPNVCRGTGCSHAQVADGNIIYFLVQTDASGIVEWMIADNTGDLAMQVTVVAYIK